MKEKVLLDTDIGSDIDDALALAYLLCQPRCELLGVTTVTGQSDLRAQMASAICRNVGRDDVPIHVGVPQAMLVQMRQDKAQQASALGDWPRRRDFSLPRSMGVPPMSPTGVSPVASSPGITAIDFLRRTVRANPGEVTLLAIGPMTNVGLLFAADPEIPAMLKRLVLMCGRFFDAMGGEWNAVGDPHATAITYGNGRQARPPRHVSFGLDVTMRCQLPAGECRGRFTAKALAPVRDFAEVWFGGVDHVTFHDPLAAACIFEPDLCTYRQGKVTVSLAEPTMGWTVFGPNQDGNPHEAAATVDSERFFRHYFDVVQ